VPDNDLTPDEPPKFDFHAFPPDTFFHERRFALDRRGPGDLPPTAKADSPTPTAERRKKDRRRRIDPTTFDKQYTPDELEFMSAMQDFKVQSGKPFPTYREVLKVAASLGYRRVAYDVET